MTQVQKFLQNLDNFATICKDDLSEMRSKEHNLNSSFRYLQSDVKRSILHSKDIPKSNKVYESPLAMRRRLFPDQIKLRPPPNMRKAQSNIALRPVPYPTRFYALRAQPSKAARRLYQPKALLQRQEEKLEEVDECLKYPTPEKALSLDGHVDPVLHVGTFAVEEYQWATPLKINVC